jgi:hypothetical protein
LARSGPREIFKVKDDQVAVAHPKDCPICAQGGKVGEGADELEFEPGAFIFSFETDGSITALRALKEAMKLLRARFEGFEKVKAAPMA